MRVDSLWQHPVKSMIGHTVTSAELVTSGMVGDRAWAVRDEQRGGIRGAKKIAGLMKLAARHDGEGVAITLPDGGRVHSNDADIDQRLSAALGHSVSLWPLQPATDLDHYRRGAADSDDVVVELRSIFGREEHEPLPDFGKFPPEVIEFESPPGTYLDAYPLLLISTSALRSLSDALPDSAIDVRRFRPNVVIDTADASGHPEFEWIGRRYRIGSAVVEVVETCPRCVMVTQEISAALPADKAVLRHIVRDLGQDVGVYATVVQPGTCSQGDELIPA